jgi:hypothetical protein
MFAGAVDRGKEAATAEASASSATDQRIARA